VKLESILLLLKKEIMKKYRQLFYKSSRDGRVIDNAISIWTFLWNPLTKNYSHVERWYPDENGDFYSFAGGILGECQSSTMGQIRKKGAPPVDGTVRRGAAEVLKNLKNWDWTEVEVKDEDFEYAEKRALERLENNKGYSKKDISRFFMPLWLQKTLGLYDETRDICSEENTKFAIDCKVIDCKDPVISPRRLSTKYKKKGYKIYQLDQYI